MEIYKDTLGCLLDNHELSGDRDEALGYTDNEEIIKEIISMKGWKLIDATNGRMVDAEKNAFEKHWDIESSTGEKYRYTSSWYNNIGGDFDLRNTDENHKVTLRKR